MDEHTITEGKTLAWVSYLPIFGLIVAYFLNNDRRNAFTSFHIRQALGLWLLYFVCGISISNLDSEMLRYALWIFFGILLLYGFINAIMGKVQTVPVLGPLFQKWFANIGE